MGELKALQAQQMRREPRCWWGPTAGQFLVVPRLPNPPLAKVAPTSPEGPRLPRSALQQRLVARPVSKPRFHHTLGPPQLVPWQGPQGPLSLARATGDSSTGETRMGGGAAATRAWLPDIPG